MVNVRQPVDVAQILLSVLFFSHHDCGMSVDCTTLYSRLCMGRYSGYRHLAGIVTFAKDHVWSPLSRRSGDDAVISDGVYHPYCFAG